MTDYALPSARMLVLSTIILSLTVTVAGSAYDISFVGIDVDETDLSVGDDLSYQTNIVNLAESPHTDLDVRGMLIRNSDRNLVFERDIASDIDLAPRELHTVTGSHELPDDVPSGDYEWIIQAYTQTGVPVAYMSSSVSITNPNEVPSVTFAESGVYLMIDRVQVGDGYVREFEQPTYGSSGQTAIPGRPFDIMFELNNDGTTEMDLRANVEIVPTYDASNEPIESFSEDLGTLAVGASEEYNITASVEEPGTYRVVTDIVDGDGTVRAEGEVRLVIGGNGGSIVNVANQQDTYDEGETMNVDVSYVGPADGSSIVEDAALTATVLDGDETVVEEDYQISQLPFTVESHSFSMDAPEDLDQYTLEVTLGKDGTTYDTFTAEYQNLDPERVLTDDGEVRVQGECIDDGTCTQAEYEKGGCFDCRNKDEPPEETSYFNEVDETPSGPEDPGDETEEPDDIAPAWLWIVGGVLAVVILAGVLSKKFKEEI